MLPPSPTVGQDRRGTEVPDPSGTRAVPHDRWSQAAAVAFPEEEHCRHAGSPGWWRSPPRPRWRSPPAPTSRTTRASSSAAGSGSGGGGKTVIVSTDLPLQGSSASQSQSTNQLIQLYLDQIGSKAGNYTIQLKPYDDSTAAKGAWDDAACAKNATDHVANANEVAVMGTFNSGCAKIEVPVLNQAEHADGLARQHQPGSDQEVGHRRAGEVLPDRQAHLRPRGHHRRLPGQRGRGLRQDRPEGHQVLRAQRQPDLRSGRRQGVQPTRPRRRASRSSARSPGTPSRPATPRCSRRPSRPVPTASTSAASTTTTVASWSRTRSPCSATTPRSSCSAPDGFTGYTDLLALPQADGMYLTFAGLSTDQLIKTDGPGKKLIDAYTGQVRQGADRQLPAVRRGRHPGHPGRDRQVGRHPRRASPTRCSSGAGINIPAADSVTGKEIKIDPTTGDTNAKDITVEVVKDKQGDVLQGSGRLLSAWCTDAWARTRAFGPRHHPWLVRTPSRGYAVARSSLTRPARAVPAPRRA